MHLILDVQMQEVVVSDTVHGGDQEFSESDILGEDEGRDSDGPIHIGHFVNVVEILEEVHLLSQFGMNACRLKRIVSIEFEYLRYLTVCSDQFRQELIESFSGSLL